MLGSKIVIGQFRYLASEMFPWVAVLHHLLFASAVGAILSGNRRPGVRLLTLAFASMAFTVFYSVPADGELVLVSVVFLTLMFCLLYDAARPVTVWSAGSGRPAWLRRVAWFCVAWGFCYPAYFRPLWLAPVAAPLGVLPAPALLALLGMLTLAFPQTNRLVHWAAALAGVVFTLFGLFYLRNLFDLPLAIITFLALRDLRAAVRQAGGITEDDLPPGERPRPAPGRARKDAVWRL